MIKFDAELDLGRYRKPRLVLKYRYPTGTLERDAQYENRNIAYVKTVP